MSRTDVLDTVVPYGGNNNWFAAYAYWYFKLYGHRDVRLLDGGRKKWQLDGRKFTTDPTERHATTYLAQEQDLSIRAFRDEVIAAIGTKNLVDVRSPDEFCGKLAAPAHLPQEQAQRRGHVPTAINVPWSKAANDDGTFKPTTNYAPSTPPPASTRPRRRSRTAASANVPATPGSSCASCSDTPARRTTTAPGSNTASLIGVPVTNPQAN